MLSPLVRLARAGSAAALVLALLASHGRSQENAAPDADIVPILDAQKSGQIQLDLRGAGEDHVQMTLRNTTERRLRVVIPAGLVAAASAAQGFQSMGLGTPTRSAGSFGGFAGGSGFRSIEPGRDEAPNALSVPAGHEVTVSLPSVCLNFGVPTPTPRDRFTLMDVDDYTPDARARKALRSLATVGTSQRVAQAVVWHVFNGLTLPQLASQLGKRFNAHELNLATRFVSALDASGSSDLVDPAYFQSGRVFVRLRGEGNLAKDAARLADELDGQTIGGLPVRVLDGNSEEPTGPAVMLLNVTLASATPKATRGRIQVGARTLDGNWLSLGQTPYAAEATAAELNGETLAAALDSALARNFVTAKVVRKSSGATTLRIENRLPFTLASASLRTAADSGTDAFALPGLGLGPGRNTTAVVPGAVGGVLHVEFNGL